jgi:pyridoxal phosphate enzyme (YggS family)
MFLDRLRAVRARMAEAACRSRRNPEDVKLLAVTKTFGVERVCEAIACGHRLFGENYIQEAREKLNALGNDRSLSSWHFIGHLQGNKARLAVQLFDVIETVDSLKLLRALDGHARGMDRKVKVYIQVNVAGESGKSGIRSDLLPGLLGGAAEFSHVEVSGLMTIPPWTSDPEQTRPWFRALRELRDRMNEEGRKGIVLRELSMGMSNDFEAAIEEGATVVRVGSALFGPRRGSIL